MAGSDFEFGVCMAEESREDGETATDESACDFSDSGVAISEHKLEK